MADQLDTPEGRLKASKVRVNAITAALDIVSGPYPGIALLDMVVLVTLNRIIWEDYYLAQEIGKPAEVVVTVFKKLETDIWSIAAKLLTPQQQEDLMTMILEYRVRRPKFTSAHFIRFSDFKGMAKETQFEEAAKPGGLFGSMEAAVQTADEIRDTAERLKYMMVRMQLIAGMQVEMLYHQFNTQPEVQQMIANIDSLQNTADNFALIFDNIPDTIGKTADARITNFMKQFAMERQATIEQFMNEFAEERRQTFDDLLSEEKRLRGVLQDLQQTMKVGVDLVANLNTTLEGVDSMATRFMPKSSAKPSKPFDIKDYEAVVEKVAGITVGLNNTLVSMEKLLSSPGWAQTMPQLTSGAERIEANLNKWMFYSFLMGAGLILIFFVALFFYHRTTKKL
jgi:hypothetical protein